MEYRELVINAAVFPSGSIGQNMLVEDLQMIKAGIIYGDSVKLHSPLALILLGMSSLGDLPFKHLLRVSGIYAEALGIPSHDHLRKLALKYPDLRRSERRAMEQRYGKALRNAAHRFKKIAKEFGVGALEAAIKSGFVEVEFFNIDAILHYQGNPKNDPMLNFLRSLLENPGEYPLLSPSLGDLASAATRDGLLRPSPRARETGRRIGLASGILQGLPTFEAASLDEIIDIRKELNSALIRFRAAMMELAALDDSNPWSRDFEHEIEDIICMRIRPALLEIKELCHQNKYLRRFMDGLVSAEWDPGVVLPMAGLVLGFAPLGEIINFVGQCAIGAGVGKVAIKAAIDRARRAEEIRTHKFYLLYRLSGDFG